MGHVLNEDYLTRCLDFITTHGATNMALEHYGIAPGAPADLILLDAVDDKSALWHQADVLANLHGGRTVFTAPRRQLADLHPGFRGDPA